MVKRIMSWFKKSQKKDYFHRDKEQEIGNNLVNFHTIQDPEQIGEIVIMEKSPYAGGKHSVFEFVVDENKRGQGIGTKLVDELLNYYQNVDFSAQVSSLPSLKIFYKKGFRPYGNLGASLEETIEMFENSWGSLNLVLEK